jgi:hypothetical protein
MITSKKLSMQLDFFENENGKSVYINQEMRRKRKEERRQDGEQEVIR